MEAGAMLHCTLLDYVYPFLLAFPLPAAMRLHGRELAGAGERG